MLEKIGILNLATDKARHAAARQEVAARNVANADTPGYRARDVTEFNAELDPGFRARRTHPAHFDFSAPRNEWREICLLYTSPSPRDRTRSRMPSSA